MTMFTIFFGATESESEVRLSLPRAIISKNRPQKPHNPINPQSLDPYYCWNLKIDTETDGKKNKRR